MAISGHVKPAACFYFLRDQLDQYSGLVFTVAQTENRLVIAEIVVESIFSFVWNLPNVDKPWNIFDDQLTNGTLQDVLRVLKAFIIILNLFIVQSGQSHPSPFSQPISQDLGPDEATPLTNDWKCRLIIKLLKIVDASKLALSQ